MAHVTALTLEKLDLISQLDTLLAIITFADEEDLRCRKEEVDRLYQRLRDVLSILANFYAVEMKSPTQQNEQLRYVESFHYKVKKYHLLTLPPYKMDSQPSAERRDNSNIRDIRTGQVSEPDPRVNIIDQSNVTPNYYDVNNYVSEPLVPFSARDHVQGFIPQSVQGDNVNFKPAEHFSELGADLRRSSVKSRVSVSSDSDSIIQFKQELHTQTHSQPGYMPPQHMPPPPHHMGYPGYPGHYPPSPHFMPPPINNPYYDPRTVSQPGQYGNMGPWASPSQWQNYGMETPGNCGLAPLKLYKFNGERGQYETWRNLFNKFVHDKPWPEHVKVSYLHQSLGDKPTSHIRTLGGKPGEYEIALDILDNEYLSEQVPFGDPIRVLEDWARLSSDHLSKLKPFRAQLRLAIGKMRAEGLHNQLNGQSTGTLLRVVIQKLPTSLVFRYHEYLKERDLVNSLLNFDSWLERKIKIDQASLVTLGIDHESASISSISRSEKSAARTSHVTSQPPRNPRNLHAAASSQARAYTSDTEQPPADPLTKPATKQRLCYNCSKSDHFRLFDCEDFLKLSVSDRMSKVKELNFCPRCLRGKHPVENCYSSNVCSVDNCGKPHHDLLHRNKPVAAPRQSMTRAHVTTNTAARSNDSRSFRTLPA